MRSKQSPGRAAFVAPIRPLSGRATARTVALLVLASGVSVGCQTLVPRQTLEVGKLEMGMKPEAVRALIGEPDGIETWPGLTTSPPSAELRPTQAWVYTDELVEPHNIGISVLLAPYQLLLAPVVLIPDAITGERTPPMWITQRTTWLYFEDERLAEWSSEYEDWFRWRPSRGGEMVFDPRIEAYRVAGCGPPDSYADPVHGDHCAHYFYQGRFYRYDDNGWCRSLHAYGPWSPIAAADLPRTLREEEVARTRPVNEAKIQAIRAAKEEADAKIEAIREAEKEAIHQARAEADAKPKRAAIRAARREAHTKIEAVREAQQAAIRVARNEANAKIRAFQREETAAVQLARIGAMRKATTEAVRAIRVEETEAIRAAKEEADAKIEAIREAEKEVIHQARTETDAKAKKASIRVARKNAHAKIKAIQETRKAAIQAARAQADAKISATQVAGGSHRGAVNSQGGGAGHRGWSGAGHRGWGGGGRPGGGAVDSQGGGGGHRGWSGGSRPGGGAVDSQGGGGGHRGWRGGGRPGGGAVDSQGGGGRRGGH